MLNNINNSLTMCELTTIAYYPLENQNGLLLHCWLGDVHTMVKNIFKLSSLFSFVFLDCLQCGILKL